MNESVIDCDDVQSYLAKHLAGRLGDRLSGTVHSYIRVHMLSCIECCERLEGIEKMQRTSDEREQPWPVRESRGGESPPEAFWSRSRLLYALPAVIVFAVVVFATRQMEKSNVARNAGSLSSGTPQRAAAPAATLPVPDFQRGLDGVTSVSGRVLLADGTTISDAPTTRVQLCCFTSGPAKWMFAPVHSDGTFEFAGIPTGQYTAELVGNANLGIRNRAVEVGRDGVSGLQLIAVERLVPIDVTVRLDTGDRPPYHPDTSIVFVGQSGNSSVGALPVVGNLFRASVRASDSYSVAVSNIADGYAIQSISDDHMTDLLNGGRLTVDTTSGSPSRVTITLSKK